MKLALYLVILKHILFNRSFQMNRFACENIVMTSFVQLELTVLSFALHWQLKIQSLCAII